MKTKSILKEIKDVKTAEEAQQIAIDWQNWASENSMSWLVAADAATYFTKLAKKFNLTDEFKENGII